MQQAGPQGRNVELSGVGHNEPEEFFSERIKFFLRKLHCLKDG